MYIAHDDGLDLHLYSLFVLCLRVRESSISICTVQSHASALPTSMMRESRHKFMHCLDALLKHISKRLLCLDHPVHESFWTSILSVCSHTSIHEHLFRTSVQLAVIIQPDCIHGVFESKTTQKINKCQIRNPRGASYQTLTSEDRRQTVDGEAVVCIPKT